MRQRKYIVFLGFHTFLCWKYKTLNPTTLPHRIFESQIFVRQSLVLLLCEEQVFTKKSTWNVKYGILKIYSRQNLE